MKAHEIIKNLRKLSGLNQEDIANVLITSRSNYTNKENGKIAFTADEILIVLKELRGNLSTETYQSAVTELLGLDEDWTSQGRAQEPAAPSQPLPTPIDSITKIIFNAMERSGETMSPEEVREIADMLRDYKKTHDQVTAGSLMDKYQDKEAGIEINELLIQLESLDIEEFHAAIGLIKGKVKRLEQTAGIHAQQGPKNFLGLG